MALLIERFAREEDGATAIEYALVASMISIVCVAAFMAFGGSLVDLFGRVNTETTDALN